MELVVDSPAKRKTNSKNQQDLEKIVRNEEQNDEKNHCAKGAR